MNKIATLTIITTLLFPTISNAMGANIISNSVLEQVGKTMKNKQKNTSKKVSYKKEMNISDLPLSQGAEQCNHYGVIVTNGDMEQMNFNSHFNAVKRGDGKFYTMCNNKLGMPQAIEKVMDNELSNQILVWHKFGCQYRVAFSKNRVTQKSKTCVS